MEAFDKIQRRTSFAVKLPPERTRHLENAEDKCIKDKEQ